MSPTNSELRRAERPVVVPLGAVVGIAMLLFLCAVIGGFMIRGAS